MTDDTTTTTDDRPTAPTDRPPKLAAAAPPAAPPKQTPAGRPLLVTAPKASTLGAGEGVSRPRAILWPQQQDPTSRTSRRPVLWPPRVQPARIRR
jgi:hypothetical protein